MEANNRAMREACKVVIDAIETIYAHEDDAEFVRVWLDQTKKACEEALAAPPRNCDVGDTENQHARFVEFCRTNFCDKCPLFSNHGMSMCFAKWSQMPYEAEEGGAK